MILGMGSEMVREGVDPFGEHRHLHLGRPGVGFVLAELRHHTLLVVPHSRVLLPAC